MVYVIHRNCVFGQQSIANTGFIKNVDTLNMEKKKQPLTKSTSNINYSPHSRIKSLPVFQKITHHFSWTISKHAKPPKRNLLFCTQEKQSEKN